MWEVRAAADAAGGRFKDAVHDQARAINQAAALGWYMAALHEREESYAADRPWAGNLMAF